MPEIAALVALAAEGDQDAWNALVDRFNNLVWAVARAFRLSSADAADVVQTTWLRLVEQLDRVREPERLGAWLATTARREALHLIRRSGRQLPTGDIEMFDGVNATDPEPDARLVVDERDKMLWRCVDGLTHRCHVLLRILMADPAPSYEEVSAALDLPVGSIGPTRARCLERLRTLVVRAGISADAEGL
ncbi:MAG: sigma-70 family RNA polymerase sigma factor [Nitriliruptorales bacterium]|nr:sigma-70 family RNA polymerase sigma factor [Nitriliruptorales bacterium]